MSAPPGDGVPTAGPYALRQPLGAGGRSGAGAGAGGLWLGRHRATGAEAAVRVLRRADLLADGDLLRRAERELGALRLLSHPNVVRLLDVVHTPDRVCLVLEYVPGSDLRPAVDGHRLPSTTAFRHFYGLLAAVEYCHDRGLSHRNLCAENVLLDGEGRVRLTGFGDAALIHSAAVDEPSPTRQSPQYSSPEVLLGLPPDGPKSDLWSCGVLCYGLVSGRLPFWGTDLANVITKVCAVEYDVPLDHTVDQAHFISRMLTANTSQRATPAQLRQHPWWMAMCIQTGLDPDGPGAVGVVTAATADAFPAVLPLEDPEQVSSNLMAMMSFDSSGIDAAATARTVTSGRPGDAAPDAEERPPADPAEPATSSNCTSHAPAPPSPAPAGAAGGAAEETFSEAVAKIMGAALTGLDAVDDPAELRRRLQRMISEFKHVRAYADTLHQQVEAANEAIRALNSSPSPKRVCWVPQEGEGPDQLGDIAPSILTVFTQWGWSEEEARARIQSPEHTLEKAVYHLLQIYLKGGATVPKPDHPELLSRNDAARALLHQALALQSAQVRNNRSRSEPALLRASMGPTSWPAIRQFSEGALVVRPSPAAAEDKPKKKGFSWARLFRWRASSVRQLSPEEKAKEQEEKEKERGKEKEKKDKGKAKGKEKQALTPQGASKVKGFLQ